jgi:hypothetical protein
MTRKGGLIFISCGQVTPEEKELGQDVFKLVDDLTPHTPYYADYQSNFEGVTRNILCSLDDAVGLIAVMHHRGRIVFPDNSEHIRASVWIEQEIAIAAYITQVLDRKLTVAAYIQDGIRLEGLRDKIQLNAKSFITNSEVLNDLRTILPTWKDLPPTLKSTGPPKLRFQFERGEVSNYIFKFTNDEDDEILVKEIILKHADIELTDPLRPDLPEDWKLPPRRSIPIGKTVAHQKNPASVLADLSDPNQIEMYIRTTVDVVVACEIRGHIHQLTRKFSVRVSRMNNSIDAMH